MRLEGYVKVVFKGARSPLIVGKVTYQGDDNYFYDFWDLDKGIPVPDSHVRNKGLIYKKVKEGSSLAERYERISTV